MTLGFKVLEVGLSSKESHYASKDHERTSQQQHMGAIATSVSRTVYPSNRKFALGLVDAIYESKEANSTNRDLRGERAGVELCGCTRKGQLDFASGSWLFCLRDTAGE
eukprot:5920539-Amphidinium_carterae.1